VYYVCDMSTSFGRSVTLWTSELSEMFCLPNLENTCALKHLLLRAALFWGHACALHVTLIADLHPAILCTAWRQQVCDGSSMYSRSIQSTCSTAACCAALDLPGSLFLRSCRRKT
jgi:hypothetical protein